MFVRRWFFKMIFPLVRRTMSPKLRSRVRVLSNYGELTDEIDAEQLLPEVRLMFISDLAFSICTVCATIEIKQVCVAAR